MLNKSIFFSRIPKYLYHKDKTPYFTNPNKMSLVQSQYELFSYGILTGTIFSFIGLAAILSIKNYFELEFVFWITFSLATIISIHLTIKKGIMTCCYLISFAPSILVLNLIYDNFVNELSFAKIGLLSILLIFLVKYGIRLIKIVFYQNKKLSGRD